MEENMRPSGHPEGCRCMMCAGGCGRHRHGPLHWLIKIVILLVVFWVGMQVGELHAYRYGMMGGYGRYGMMRGYGTYDGNYYYGPGGAANATSSTQ